MKINEYVAGKFLSAMDFVDGENVKFQDEGEETTFADGRKAITFVVELKNEETRKWSPNPTTLKALGVAWGTETEGWVGKKAKLNKVKQSVKGKLVDVIYGVPNDFVDKDIIDIEID